MLHLAHPKSRGGIALALFLATLPLPAAAQSRAVSLGGQTVVNHGLVGVGRIAANHKDKFGETFGSFSAFAFEPGSWRRNADGSYSGTLFAQPDRGYNAVGTTNYVPRFNKLTVRFSPAAAGAAVQNQVALTLTDTILFSEANGTPMTSLDPVLAVNPPRAGLPTSMPQASNGRLSLDGEGIVVNRDGSLWVSDEYGPYIFKFSPTGVLQSAIRPPEALIPKRGGVDSFASNNPPEGQSAPSPADPTSGRQNNQGLEGLSVSPDGKTLFALLQSAARQDGGTGGSSATRHHTRLLAYDLSGATPTLRGEYVIALPRFQVGTATRVAAQSELLALNNTQFLVLARDGNGRGIANPQSAYRRIVMYDISQATNIAGTAFDQPGSPIAPGGVLDGSIRAAATAELIDMNDSAQLAKFGLRNGAPDDANNLSEKWEALALVPALDPAASDDYFLFVGNDNDFLTTNGFQAGASYAAAFDNDSMVLVYRLTLPSRMVNVSSRAPTGTGANAHVAGFVVTGARPKTLLIRGAGPALGAAGLAGAASDVALAVFDSAGRQISANDNWSDADPADVRSAAQRVGAFPFADGSRDAAVLVNLDPGVYTAQVSAVGVASGISLIEVYELP